jgi:hypothetical protein
MNDVTASDIRWLTTSTSFGSTLLARSAVFQVGEGLDALVLADPQVRRREFDVVGEEHLALAACGEIGDHRAGREHVDAAADHRLEQFESRRELDEIGLDAVRGKRAAIHAEPDLSVDGQRV